MIGRGSSRRWRQRLVHSLRVVLFGVTIALIHLQFGRLTDSTQPLAPQTIEIARLRAMFPAAESLGAVLSDIRGYEVLDAGGSVIGSIQETSPGSDHVTGFSGPTNVRIALTTDGKIAGLDIVSSRDTPEHVRQVLDDELFLSSFAGLGREEVVRHSADAVSGATLTSMAIQESVIHALSGRQVSLRFPQPLTADDVRPLFPMVQVVEPTENDLSGWLVLDQEGRMIGQVCRSSPHSDSIIGYQGPSDTLIGIDIDDRIVGVRLAASYDNEPYTEWVREDASFQTLFQGRTLNGLADPESDVSEVEGVSGATMTSQAVARGLVETARQRQQALEAESHAQVLLQWSLRDAGTAMVILSGVLIAFTSLRRRRVVRVMFQLLLIGYLGLMNGDMVSQAMLVGWARSGIPWERAGGLVLLTLAAVCIPVVTGRNVYCTHLCPHGAVQQLLRNRVPWRVQLSRRLTRGLRLLPVVLLLWCVTVAMTGWPFSLVDVEPFDAWLLRITGWASLAIAVVGLLASLFVPMAYCRFGCPTGAMLSWLRLNGRSDRWSRRDWTAVALVLLACGIAVVS